MPELQCQLRGILHVKTRRWFPLLLALAHAMLTVGVFVIAVQYPERSGLLPVVVFTVDLPFSFLIMVAARAIGVSRETGYAASLWSDMAFFLVLGSAWWYAIGYAITAGFEWLQNRAKPTA